MSAGSYAQQVAIAAAAALKRVAHRRWHWCRRDNGFCDNPLWRVVAERLHLPVFQVIAFANRLEEAANMAEPRGYVGDFNAAVFGIALGMPAEDAARIYAELAASDVGWVDQEHVATFWARNRDDQPDATSALRSRRTYARKMIRKELAHLAAQGKIEPSSRTAIEAELDRMADEELFELERRRKMGQLAAAPELSTSHAFSHRENVRPHTRADHSVRSDSVDNSGDVARGDTAGSAMSRAEPGAAPPETAEEWLKTEGMRIVTDRMRLYPGVASVKIERWKREVGFDVEAIAQMIDAARQQGSNGDAFELSVQAQIDQRKLDSLGPRLPLIRKFGGAA